MSIDKSIRQHYQEGDEVNPYRKGLEIIAGKGKEQILPTIKPAKITAKDLIQPAEKMTPPSVKKDRVFPPIKTMPKTARAALDPNKYRRLASAFFDKIKAGEESYLDKYINRDPVRIVERAAEAEPPAYPTDVHPPEFDYLTSSLVGTDKATTPSDIDNILAQLTTSPKTDTAATFTDKGETVTSYNDTQMQDIFKSGDQETKNFITTIFKTANDTIDNLGIDKSDLATGFIKNKVGKVVATELGISGGAAGGPIGMLIGWLVGKAVEKFTGGKKEETEEIEGIFSFADEGSTDKPVDKPTVEDTAAMEDIITAPPKRTVTYTPPVRHHTGGNGGGRNGGGGKGSSPSDAPGSPFFRGGRVDKALGGRSRDIG